MSILLPDNPFVPPKDGRCIVNELPSELLSHIFSLGWAPERDQEPDEDDFEDADDSDDGSSCSRSTSSLSASHSRSRSRSTSRRRHEQTEQEKVRKLAFNVLVSHVCARWRALALGNTLLWNHITFEGPPPYDRVETFLVRAATVPLTISIDRTVADNDVESDFKDDDDDDDGVIRLRDNDRDLEIITGIMQRVLPHMEHCKALQIMVSFYPSMHRVLEMLGQCAGAPILEVLQLYHYEDADEHVSFKHPELREQPFRLFGGNAPRLNVVALWGVHVDWSQEGSPFLCGLTDLELAYHSRDVRPSFYDLARILRTSPDLRTLTLCLSCPAGEPDEWPGSGMPDDPDDESMMGDPLVMPKIQELVVAYLAQPYLISLFSRITLPMLTSLALDLENYDYSEFLRYLMSAISYTQSPLSLRGPGIAGARPRTLLSNLTSLKIASFSLQDLSDAAAAALVLDAYRQLYSLTSLNINCLYLPDVWFNLLLPCSMPNVATAPSAVSASEVLLPRLETLTTTGVDGGRIRELVATRGARGVPLTTVLMNQDDEIDPADEAWLGTHLERFEYFEGSDEETDGSDDSGVGPWDFDDSDGAEWEDAEDDDEDDYDVDEFEAMINSPF